MLVVNPERVRQDDLWPAAQQVCDRYSAPGCSILDTLATIRNRHNRRHADHWNFYGSDGFDSDLEEAQRAFVRTIPADLAITVRFWKR